MAINICYTQSILISTGTSLSGRGTHSNSHSHRMAMCVMSFKDDYFCPYRSREPLSELSLPGLQLLIAILATMALWKQKRLPFGWMLRGLNPSPIGIRQLILGEPNVWWSSFGIKCWFFEWTCWFNLLFVITWQTMYRQTEGLCTFMDSILTIGKAIYPSDWSAVN